MDKIRLVIAELEVLLVLLESQEPDSARIKTTVNRAVADLGDAAKALIGQNTGVGEV